MKKLFTTLALGTLIAVTTSAYDPFVYQEMEYTPLSANTCALTSVKAKTGDLTIPQTVTNAGVTYTVTEVGKKAVGSGPTSIKLPATVKTLQSQSFYFSSNLKSIEMPGVEVIESLAFSWSGLTGHLALPETCTTLKTQCFDACKNLTSVYIDAALEDYSIDAFGRCSNITSFEVSPECGLMRSYEGALYNTKLTTLTRLPFAATALKLAPTCNEIGSQAMEYCDKIKEMVIPEQITKLQAMCFKDMTGLETITISEGLKEIPIMALYECSALKTITFPASLESVGNSNFFYDKKLEKIIFKCTTPPATSNPGFENVVYGQCTLVVPKGCVAAYRAANNWKNFTNIVEDGGSDQPENPAVVGQKFTVGGINYIVLTDQTCAIASNPTTSGNVVIPETVKCGSSTLTVTEVQTQAFYQNQNLTSIKLPKTVTVLNRQAFWFCKGMTSIEMPGVEKICTKALSWTGLKGAFRLPETCTTCEAEAFDASQYITSVYIPAAMEDFAMNTFGRCYGIESFEISPDCEIFRSYEGSIFSNSLKVMLRAPYAATSIKLPSQCVEFGSNSMEYCAKFSGSFTLPAQITKIGTECFKGMTGVTEFTFNEGIEALPMMTLYEQTSLETVNLPASLKSVGDYAFSYDTKLKTINFKSTTPPATSNPSFEDGIYAQCTLVVPQGCVAAYKAANIWKKFTNIEEATSTGVETIVTDSESPVYYDLQGRRVDNPTEGLYIRVQGNKATKVYR